MKECETCANYIFMKKGYCRAMMEKPKKLRCYMTEQESNKAEEDIVAYSFSRTPNKTR